LDSSSALVIDGRLFQELGRGLSSCPGGAGGVDPLRDRDLGPGLGRRLDLARGSPS